MRIVNKDSEDKDCADLKCHYISIGGVVLWPATIAGRSETDLKGYIGEVEGA